MDILSKYTKKYPEYIFHSYENKRFKVTCKKCKKRFKKTGDSFQKGYGCRFCAGNHRLDYDDFLSKFQSLENSLELITTREQWQANYQNSNSKIDFKCVVCGHTFSSTPNSIIYSKSNCPACSNEKKAWRKMTFKDFLKISKDKHNDEFLFTEEYWRENYVSSKKSKFRFKCSKNHTYKTTIDSYIRGTRCPICRASKGEQYIVKFLKDYQIKFVKEKTFKDCKNEETDGIFRFDFFLSDYNLIIEYDGKQHFEEVEFFNSLEEIQSNDLQKNDFCYKNNINLIRIPYWCLENIDFILKTILFQLEV